MVSSNFLWAMFWLALLLGALAAVRYLAARARRRLRIGHDDRVLLLWVGRAAVALGVVFIFGFAVGLWPYKWEYHSFQPVSRTVAEISPRFRVDGEATSQSFAIRFTDRSQIYRCDDTRCALINPGDKLAMRCIREYQWASVSGYGCVFVRYTPAT